MLKVTIKFNQPFVVPTALTCNCPLFSHEETPVCGLKQNFCIAQSRYLSATCQKSCVWWETAQFQDSNSFGNKVLVAHEQPPKVLFATELHCHIDVLPESRSTRLGRPSPGWLLTQERWEPLVSTLVGLACCR